MVELEGESLILFLTVLVRRLNGHILSFFHFESAGAPFKKFASLREEWALKNRYISPGSLHLLLF